MTPQVTAVLGVSTPTPTPTPNGQDSCLGGLTDLFGCLLNPVTETVGNAVSTVWMEIAESFAEGAADMLGGFAGFFVQSTTINLAAAGVRATFLLCAGIAAVVAVVVLATQVGSSVLRRDGAGVGRALVGAGQAWVLLSSLLVLTSTLLAAADQLTVQIVGDGATYSALQTRLTTIFAGGGTVVGPALLLVFGLVGIALAIVLYVEMLARQAAIVVLVATSPIAVAGLLGDRTRSWCTKTATMTLTLIFLKPVVAVIFAVGLNAVGTASGVNGILSALAILLVAAIAWPVLARLLSFTAVGGGAGALAGVALGALAARGAGRSSGGTRGSGEPLGATPTPSGGDGPAPTGGMLAGRGMGVGGGSGTTRTGGGAASGAGAGLGAAGGVAAGVGVLAAAAARAAQLTAAAVDRVAEHGGADGVLTHGSPYAAGGGGYAAGYAAANRRDTGQYSSGHRSGGHVASGGADPAAADGGSGP